MGTILTHAEPLVSGTRTEDEIRHHERQLCATELLILAEAKIDRHDARAVRWAAGLIARREVQV